MLLHKAKTECGIELDLGDKIPTTRNKPPYAVFDPKIYTTINVN